MNASVKALLQALDDHGVRLSLGWGTIKVLAPKAPPPKLLQALRRNKAAVMLYMSNNKALKKDPRVPGSDGNGATECSPSAADIQTEPGRPCVERCYACGSDLYWRSIHRALICSICHPPGSESLFAGTIRADETREQWQA